MPRGQLLISFVEAGKEPEQSFTLGELPAGRMIGKPLYVLIDGGVGSAAEEFAYSVQQFGLGRLVGETTAGGANVNSFVPIPPGFLLSVSVGRPVHPVSGGNRSEEHTSELQSLMRISYAVFCLTKKKTLNH